MTVEDLQDDAGPIEHLRTGRTLQVARLKRSKLVLRDQIKWIEGKLTPDIIA